MLKEKKWLATLLTVVMIFAIIPTTVFAVGTDEYFNVDGIYYQIVDENAKTVEVVHPKKSTGLSGAGASSYSGDFEVPAVVTYNENEYSVVGIDSEAFYAANITSITLPEGLKYIDGNAFRQSKLTSIHIPSTVETIGTINNPDSIATAVNPVFNRDNDQVKLTSITFAPNSQLRAIGGGAFQSTGIKTIDLPESLQTIDPYAFSACTELEEIAFPESVTDIYFRAFSGCRSLKELNISADIDLHTESGSNGSRFFGALTGWLDNNYGTVTFGEGSRYAVEDGLFYDGNDLLGPTDKNVESVVIREGTELIAPYAFYQCDSLSSVDIPDSLTTISQNAFANCSSLENIDLRNVTTLEQWAFMYSGLKSIVIPEGVTTIPLATFANIDNLSFIKISSTVTEIGLGAFQKLSMPEGMNVTVIMDAVSPPTMDEYVFRNIPIDRVALIIPAGSEEAYAANAQLGEFITKEDGTIEDNIGFKVELPDSMKLCPDKNIKLETVIELPTGASIAFSSSNKDVATVDEQGNVTGVSNGEATITASIILNDITIASDTCIVTVGHGETELKDAKEATCTKEGYTGDKVCTVCGEVVEQGAAIAKLPHNFEDGKCTVCGAADPNYKPTEPGDGDTNVPETGDSSNMALWFALLFLSGSALCTTLGVNKRRIVKRK